MAVAAVLGEFLKGVASGAVKSVAGKEAQKSFDGSGSASEKASAIGAGIGAGEGTGKMGGQAPTGSSMPSQSVAPLGAMPLSPAIAGKLEKGFYGHYLPSHFKKTSIISTSGRVR